MTATTRPKAPKARKGQREQAAPWERRARLLKEAAGNGHIHTVRRLLAQKALPGGEADVALLEAALHGQAKIVALLLAHGAGLNPIRLAMALSAADGTCQTTASILREKLESLLNSAHALVPAEPLRGTH